MSWDHKICPENTRHVLGSQDMSLLFVSVFLSPPSLGSLHLSRCLTVSPCVCLTLFPAVTVSPRLCVGVCVCVRVWLGAKFSDMISGFGVERNLSPSGCAAFWDPFLGLCQWVCAASENVWPWTAFRCEIHCASIAKIGKPYSTSFEN